MPLWLWRRDTLIEALSPLGKLNDGFYGGDAIYIWARLPPGARAWVLPLCGAALQVTT
jgi:hypothetical protein